MHWYITKANAVLWLSGEPPAGLHFELPEGQPMPAPDPRDSLVSEYLAWFNLNTATVVLDAMVDRNYATAALARIVEQRLVDELRTRYVLSYSPSVDYQPLTGNAAKITVVADLIDGQHSDGVRCFIECVQSLTEAAAITEGDLQAWRHDISKNRDHPEFAFAMAVRTANDLLLGRPPLTLADLDGQPEQVTAADVAQAAQAMLANALVCVPNGVRMNLDPWHRAPNNTVDPVAGQVFASYDKDRTKVLRISMQGITISPNIDDGTGLTVHTDATAAVLWWPDGRRELIGHDGVTLPIEPNLWHDSAQIVTFIDSNWGNELRVPMGNRSPSEIPPRPARATAR